MSIASEYIGMFPSRSRRRDIWTRFSRRRSRGGGSPHVSGHGGPSNERPVPRPEGNRMRALRIVACLALVVGSLAGLVSDRADAAPPCSPRLASLGGAGDGAAGRALCRPSRSGERGSASAAVPEVEGPVTGGRGVFGVVGPFVAATNFDLADVGYEQEEYFISGTARAYDQRRPARPRRRAGRSHRPARATYKTRIVVYRPIDRARFNGTVVGRVAERERRARRRARLDHRRTPS